MHLTKIEEVYSISKTEFKEKFVKTDTPVILKNFSKNWKVWEDWDYEYFKHLAGSHNVNVYGKWQENSPEAIEMPNQTTMKLANYLDLIKQQPTDLRLFRFNLFEMAPELKMDFDYPDIIDHWVKLPYLFFGGEGSDVRFHYDIDHSHVFLTQITGIKRVVLFGQDQNKYLYKLPYTTHSLADLREVNYEKFPALKYAEGYEAYLEPGDTIFMPGGMWHYNQYITQGCSLSIRALKTQPIDLLKGSFNILIARYIDRILNKRYHGKWVSYKTQKAFEIADAAILEQKITAA